MSSAPDDAEFLTREQLFERGWFQGTINRFFSHPDRGSSWSVPLYRAQKVRMFESLSIFPAVQDYHRKEAKQARIERSKEFEHQIEQVEQKAVKLPDIAMENLRQNALEHHNSRTHKPPRWRPLIPPRGFWEPILVDYLLFVGEDRDLAELFDRKAPRERIWAATTGRVLAAIAAKYPELANECVRRGLVAQ